MKAWNHLKTINKHKLRVMISCFQVGLYKQGLLHDLSKYSPVEFMVGAKYYQGDSSPNNAERRDKGYSSAWLHHKGCNKHHLEYWIDYGNGDDRKIQGIKMPKKYVVEMFIDRICACKNYQGDQYSQEAPLVYYDNGKQYFGHMMHKETQRLLEELLQRLAENGEEETFSYIRNVVLSKEFNYE